MIVAMLCISPSQHKQTLRCIVLFHFIVRLCYVMHAQVLLTRSYYITYLNDYRVTYRYFPSIVETFSAPDSKVLLTGYDLLSSRTFHFVLSMLYQRNSLCLPKR